MEADILLLIFLSLVTGAVVGSFLNVVILRGQERKSLGGRSRCRGCGKTLGVWELIPILSFFIQKGRCLSCETALLVQYPLVEGLTAVSYAGAAWYIFSQQPPAGQSFLMVFLSFLGIAAAIIIIISDFKYYTIPNSAVVILFFLGLIAARMRILDFPGGILPALFGEAANSLGFAGFFAILWYISGGRWMGFGDAKLVFATSWLLGFPASMAAFLFSFWLGALASLPLLLLGKKNIADKIPFGPYIVLGSLLAYFFTEEFLVLADLQWFFH